MVSTLDSVPIQLHQGRSAEPLIILVNLLGDTIGQELFLPDQRIRELPERNPRIPQISVLIAIPHNVVRGIVRVTGQRRLVVILRATDCAVQGASRSSALALELEICVRCTGR